MSNESLSLDKKVEIHGVEIRKMPNGRFLSAMQLMKELPETFVKEVLDGKKDFKLSDMLTIENLADTIGKLLYILPDFTLKFLAELMDVKLKTLRDELSPVETLEVVEKFIEINRLNDFFIKMKPVIAKFMKSQTLTGFNVQ